MLHYNEYNAMIVKLIAESAGAKDCFFVERRKKLMSEFFNINTPLIKKLAYDLSVSREDSFEDCLSALNVTIVELINDPKAYVYITNNSFWYRVVNGTKKLLFLEKGRGVSYETHKRNVRNEALDNELVAYSCESCESHARLTEETRFEDELVNQVYDDEVIRPAVYSALSTLTIREKNALFLSYKEDTGTTSRRTYARDRANAVRKIRNALHNLTREDCERVFSELV